MKLPKLPISGHSSSKEVKKEYFLSIVLRQEKVSAVSFEEEGGVIKVLGQGHEEFSEDIEKATEQELLEKLDKSISIAESALPDDITTHKTIFGLKETWVEAGKIKKDYLAKLKKICDELELKPVGFLVVAEAVAHLLEKEEGAPITAILAEVGKNYCTVSLIKAGKLLETKSAALQNSAPYTVDVLLKHFQRAEILPSRILLLDGGSENLVQEFIGFSWSKSLPFLHLPQVSSLAENFDAKSVLAGAAVQMEFTMSASVDSFFGDAQKDEIEPMEMVEPTLSDKDENEPTIGSELQSGQKTKGEDEFGFIANEDVAKPEEEITSDNINLEGVQDGDEFQEIPEDVALKQTDKKSFPVNGAFIVLGFKKFLNSLKKINIGKAVKGAPAFAKSGQAKLLAIPTVLIILLLVVLFIYFFKTSATITLAISPQDNSKTQSATFSSDSSTDTSKGIIAATASSISEDGKLTENTTGKKKTGDKAKGKVTIVSSVTSPQTISKGTTVTSSNGLDFTLDADVKIASSSGVSDVQKTSGGVTASDFGKDYNLPSGTKFSIKGYDKSSVEAKNDDAFTGGSEKDITIVAKADQDKLAADIVKNLTSKAQDDLKKKLDGDTLLLPIFVKTSFDTKNFSKDVGDESSNESITATVKFDGLTYKQSDLYDFAKSKLNNSNSNLTVNPEDFSVDVKDAKIKNPTTVSANLSTHASLIPKINKDDVAQKIKGKSPQDAEAILKAMPLVNSVDVSISPAIPLLPKRIPPATRLKIIVNTNG